MSGAIIQTAVIFLLLKTGLNFHIFATMFNSQSIRKDEALKLSKHLEFNLNLDKLKFNANRIDSKISRH